MKLRWWRNSGEQQASLGRVDHRPWPVPERRWIMGQTWTSLLFAHWQVPIETLEKVIPAGLTLDTWDGSAWVGVTPFQVESLRMRGAPPMPGISSFPEVNVRTYVTVEDKPGIYFFSLDTPQKSAVYRARRGYRLPYFQSEIEMIEQGYTVRFRSQRVSSDGPSARLDVEYLGEEKASEMAPATLGRWLTERYCLYTLDEKSNVLRGEIHHRPWKLSKPVATFHENTLTQGLGFELEGDPVLHLAPRQGVVFWSLTPAS